MEKKYIFTKWYEVQNVKIAMLGELPPVNKGDVLMADIPKNRSRLETHIFLKRAMKKCFYKHTFRVTYIYEFCLANMPKKYTSIVRRLYYIG